MLLSKNAFSPFANTFSELRFICLCSIPIPKANFLSTVTHELRTPLYAVTGLTNMLLEEDPKPEQIQHLKSLKFSGDYLLTFINDILQINKSEAHKVDIEPEPFNLKKLEMCWIALID